MKKNIITICMFFILAGNTFAQDYPQYFSTYYRNEIIKNPLTNYYWDDFLLSFEQIADTNMQTIDFIDLNYKRYIIWSTSIILYSTVNGDSIPFKISYGDGEIDCDFGAKLMANRRNDDYCVMRFDTVISKIDPALFSNDITMLYLPKTKGLSYTSSPDMSVRNLAYMSGGDVVQDKLSEVSSLIDKDSVLIAVAAAGKKSYFIPENVKRIGAGALRNITVQEIFFQSSITSIDPSAFEGLSPTCKIYIHAEEKKRMKKMLPKLKKQFVEY